MKYHSVGVSDEAKVISFHLENCRVITVIFISVKYSFDVSNRQRREAHSPVDLTMFITARHHVFYFRFLVIAQQS
jgi:hypothetical protein